MNRLFVTFAAVAALSSAASATLPDFEVPSPAAVLASAKAAPEVRVAAVEDGRTLQRDRSVPRHRFAVDSLNGAYGLVERLDPEHGCIDASRTGDDAITLVYERRTAVRSWAPDDHYESLSVRTPQDFVLDFVSDIDQGPMQYTRHDVENPTFGDTVGCVAWFANLGVADAYRYCRDSVLPKRRPEPDFNPSYFYREETRTTADGGIVAERLSVVRPSRDAVVSSLKTLSLTLHGTTLTVLKQESDGAAAKTIQRCVYTRR